MLQYAFETLNMVRVEICTNETNQQSIIVPLQFWFCRNIGLALPVMSLNHHEVVLTFTWGSSEAVKGTGVGRKPNTGATPTCEVWCEYIFLDKNEKMKYRRTQQEYLIEQLQYQPEGLSAATYELHFNLFKNAPSEVIFKIAILRESKFPALYSKPALPLFILSKTSPFKEHIIASPAAV